MSACYLSMDSSQVTAVLDIANTRHGPAADPAPRSRLAGEHDHLSEPGEAHRYLASRGMAVPSGAPDARELDRLRELRDVARAVASEGPSAARDRIEGLLSQYTYRLSADGTLVPTSSGWDGLIAHALPGLLELVAAGDRLRTCSDPDCDWLFIDRSRNHSRQWCDMGTCGSRAKMSRYRRRKRAAA
jgi:predicted RNA-binding Zn ribbon-like protein